MGWERCRWKAPTSAWFLWWFSTIKYIYIRMHLVPWNINNFACWACLLAKDFVSHRSGSYGYLPSSGLALHQNPQLKILKNLCSTVLNTLCNKFTCILKPSFAPIFRCVLAFLAMAKRPRRASSRDKIPWFKIHLNLIHSVLVNCRIKKIYTESQIWWPSRSHFYSTTNLPFITP